MIVLGRADARQLPLAGASVDAIVTDPPYGIGFMGREWDTFSPDRVAHRAKTIVRKNGPRTSERWPSKTGKRQVRGAGPPIEYDESRSGNARFQAWCEEWAREALRVLKPGGHMLVCGGPRTYHRLASGIEDAGFEVRDSLVWLFGSGFPKSLDVSKAIDRAAGAERVLTRPDAVQRDGYGGWDMGSSDSRPRYDAPATPEAAAWNGWGTALKPAYEPIVMARKPLVGKVAQNVLAHGTGALNIAAVRIDGKPRTTHADGNHHTGRLGYHGGGQVIDLDEPAGRWPPNVLLDEEAAALLDAQTGYLRTGRVVSHSDRGMWSSGADVDYADSEAGGGASRFFYTSKASRTEREAGLETFDLQRRSDGRQAELESPRLRTSARRNDHPTVKPVDLMRWLVRLVTPPGGLLLDPFMGSGSTGMAALDEGFRFAGFDLEPRYVEIARARIAHRHLLDAGVREPSPEQRQGALL